MINKVILIGNVGIDPEVRTLESGVKTARLRIATTERLYNRETQSTREHTEWHTVVLWRSLADVADRYVRKGTQVYIEGRLRSREWTDQQGVKRYTVEIMADDMKMLGRRGDSQQQDGQGGGYGAQQGGYGSQQNRGNQGGYGGGQQNYGGGQQGYGSQNASYQQTPATPQPAPAVNVDDDPDDLPF